jgi:cation diffusion facilitator CzcD-associated flavoprotein CzcO
MSETLNTVDCDVCILGAGIAGLNALYAVSRHLSAGAKVVLVDRKQAAAGMWRTTYDYVRLHQPHPQFTVGNLRWRNQPDPYHLATRAEVVDHLQHCFEELSGRAKLEAFFGYSYVQHEEQPGKPITVSCRRDADGSALRIRAQRLVKAFGYNVDPLAPLSFSHRHVVSLAPESPELLQQVGPSSSSAPIYIVGGGKTGMDTAQMLMRTQPKRTLRMLIGDGTMFLRRDDIAPGRLRRHYTGRTTLETFLDVAKRFDGRNEVQVSDYLRQTYCVSLDATCRRFLFGLMSVAENAAIRRGLDEVIRDHLVDVVDEAAGPTLVLRSGRRRPIEPGSVFINCTGYLGKVREYEPYLSASGRVLSIQSSSTVHFLSSQSAYFLAHMLMLGKLADTPLYEVDVGQLNNTSRDVFGPTAMTATLYNAAMLAQRLPRWVLGENGLDPTASFPVHRRIVALGKLLLFLRQHPTQLRDALDVVRERFHIRVGPLRHAPAPVPSPTSSAYMT